MQLDPVLPTLYSPAWDRYSLTWMTTWTRLTRYKVLNIPICNFFILNLIVLNRILQQMGLFLELYVNNKLPTVPEEQSHPVPWEDYRDYPEPINPADLSIPVIIWNYFLL